MNQIFLALDALFTRHLNQLHQETGMLPTVAFDPPWPSQCTQESSTIQPDGRQQWRPIERKVEAIFSNLEQALEITFHADIKHYYGAFWSNGLCVEFQDLAFNLIQIWNEEDEEQLKENMLGHLFAKQKNKLPLSYFIGCTDGDEVVCLNHDTGEIVLERPGQKAHKVLANNLEEFLIALKPSSDSYDR